MKRILLVFSLLLSLSLSAQSWQSKPVIRIEDAGQSFLYTFSDSSNAYINKCNVSYIVNMPNSQWVQLGYMYDGSTSRIITASYSAITQPDLSSAKILSDTLNAWLRDCATSSGGGGGGGSGTVTSVASGYGTNFSTITSTGTVVVDSTVIATKTYLNSAISTKANQSALNDTASALNGRINSKQDSQSLYRNFMSESFQFGITRGNVLNFNYTVDSIGVNADSIISFKFGSASNYRNAYKISSNPQGIQSVINTDNTITEESTILISENNFNFLGDSAYVVISGTDESDIASIATDLGFALDFPNTSKGNEKAVMVGDITEQKGFIVNRDKSIQIALDSANGGSLQFTGLQTKTYVDKFLIRDTLGNITYRDDIPFEDIVLVTESRDFKLSDAGKFLLLFDSVVMTVPTTFPFSNFDHFHLYANEGGVNSSAFYEDNIGGSIPIRLIQNEGIHLFASVQGGDSILLSLDGNGYVDTGGVEYLSMNRYLYEKSLEISIKGTYNSGAVVAQTTFTVTIPTQSNTDYVIIKEAKNATSATDSYVTNKTTTSFDVEYLAPITGTVILDYILKP